MSRREDDGDPIRIRVHEGGDRRIDGILRLIEEAGSDRPLPAVLHTLCVEVARIARADVVSFYVRERTGDEERLVMRGNTGFPEEVVGRVSLRLGEGITGFAAECMRPVSAAIAEEEAHYKHVPGTGEEHFPSFTAIPLLSGGRADGVLVLQRRSAQPFGRSEIALATALAAPFQLALERRRSGPTELSSGRSTRLPGTPVLPGEVIGVARALPAMDDLEVPPEVAADPAAAVARVYDDLSSELARLQRRLGTLPESVTAGLRMILLDQRLREELIRECGERGVVPGLREVARNYAVAPYNLSGGEGAGSEWLIARAAEVEELCFRIAVEVAEEPWAQPGHVLILPDAPMAFVAMAAVSRRVSAMAVGGKVDPEAPAIELLRRGEIPLVSEVSGLFSWVRPGDRLLVDGTAGHVRVNPTSGEVVRHRRSSDGE